MLSVLGVVALALLLHHLGLAEPLSGNDSLVLSLDLVPVAGYLVALLGSGPETVHRKPVVEIRSKVIHDADWKHDVHAELHCG